MSVAAAGSGTAGTMPKIAPSSLKPALIQSAPESAVKGSKPVPV